MPDILITYMYIHRVLAERLDTCIPSTVGCSHPCETLVGDVDHIITSVYVHGQLPKIQVHEYATVLQIPYFQCRMTRQPCPWSKPHRAVAHNCLTAVSNLISVYRIS